jgi:hypothetical protein
MKARSIVLLALVFAAGLVAGQSLTHGFVKRSPAPPRPGDAGMVLVPASAVAPLPEGLTCRWTSASRRRGSRPAGARGRQGSPGPVIDLDGGRTEKLVATRVGDLSFSRGVPAGVAPERKTRPSRSWRHRHGTQASAMLRELQGQGYAPFIAEGD